MINLAIVCLVMLGVPFLLGYLHASARDTPKPLFLYYRYFMTFNMLIASLFVATRFFFDGVDAAKMSGWPYSPLFHLYAIAVFSMAILGGVTIYARTKLLMAPAILWLIFSLLSSVAYVYQIGYHEVGAIGVMYVHIAYNLMVSAVLINFLYLFCNEFGVAKNKVGMDGGTKKHI